MTKQEEIREETARTFYENSDVSKTIAWLDLPRETKDPFFYKADNLLYRFHSRLGVVIKVDGELPDVLWLDNVGVSRDTVKAIIDLAVEPLIKESKVT